MEAGPSSRRSTSAEVFQAAHAGEITTCDSCRARKVRCTSLQGEELIAARAHGKGESCKACYRREEDCNFEYRYKKPGRPRGSTKRQTSSPTGSRRSSTSRPPQSPSTSYWRPSTLAVTDLVTTYDTDGRHRHPPQSRSYLDVSSYASANAPSQYGPATGTIFGSALSAMSHEDQLGDLFGAGRCPPTPANGYEPVQGIVNDLGSRGYAGGSHQADKGLNLPSGGATSSQRNEGQKEWTLAGSATLAHSSPAGRPFDYPSVSSTSHPPLPQPLSSSSVHAQNHPATQYDIPQIEAVATWHDVCFFISLHMRHQHGLMPLVHKPTFAQDVLQRRDMTDETFRGLLCSIVAYTICQCPINIVSPPYSRQDLELILRRCQKTSRAIQLRWHMTPSLESLASIQLDINTALAATQVDLATALIADARRQVYALSLHTAQPKEGLTCIELEICRRLFWEIYQSDKTNVMNAISPISLNDLEGIPPLPLEVDDDYITNTLATSQPEGTISYMTGFVVVSRIFQILGQCQIRQKTYANNKNAGPPRVELLEWVEQQRLGMRRLLEDLPGKLRADWREAGGFEKAEESSLGIQRANIHITALCVELALLDFRVHLDPEEDTRTERETLARKAYATLSSVPIEYLASNGESMRGKVLRIVLDLLSMASGSGTDNTGTENQPFGKDVWDWWNMYSSVQFFQVIPEIAENKSGSA